jgi:ABC-type sugar transport system substrate-binding protein/AraC-like DNA-binding protein
MPRLFTIWICCLAWLTLSTGCNGLKTQKHYLIGFSQCTYGDNWRKTMQRDMERELEFYPDLSLKITDAGGNSQTQIGQIKALIDDKVDLLVVSPNEAEPITPVVEKAFNSGIPVIMVDRRIASGLYTAFVGGNNPEIGVTAGEYISKLLSGKGKVVEIWGLPGSSPAIDRDAGFRKAIQSFPGMQITAQVFGQWEKEVATRQLPAFEDKLRDADAIFAHNDVMAVAASEFFTKKNIQHRPRFIGVDGLPGANGGIEWVSNGVLDATLLYPTGGQEAIRLAALILNHAPYEKENILGTTVITPDNVRMLKMQTDKMESAQQEIERQERKINDQIKVYHSQQILIFILLGSLLAGLLFAIFFFRSTRERQKANALLESQNQEIHFQRDKIAELAAQLEEATAAQARFFNDLSLEMHQRKTLDYVQDDFPEIANYPAFQPTGHPGKDFSDAFAALVERNLTDPDFGVPEICRALGLSRVQLYRKVKMQLGYGVSDYILQERLRMSKRLLTEKPDLSVAEVAYASGFASPSYFSTVFKAKFDCSPTEWRS